MISKNQLVKKIDGYKMHLDPSLKGVSGILIEQGYREPCFMWILRSEARGDLAIDIGANIGYTTLNLARKMKHVIAIEPDRRSRKFLKRSITENNLKKRISVYKFAISNKVGEDVLYLARNNPNLSSLCKVAMTSSKKDKYRKTIIKTKTIDSLNILPNFIKMDVEGYEVEALEGGMNILRQVKSCKILVEVHPKFYTQKRNFAKILLELFNIGFYPKYIVSAASSSPKLFKKKSYKPFMVFKDGDHERGIYEDIKKDDVINFSCFPHSQTIKSTGKMSNKIVRSLLLVK